MTTPAATLLTAADRLKHGESETIGQAIYQAAGGDSRLVRQAEAMLKAWLRSDSMPSAKVRRDEAIAALKAAAGEGVGS